MKIQTVNQLISVWKDIATRHYQINGFGIGDDWENGATEKTHPVLWINPVTASMPSTDNGYKTFEIDFEVKLFDLVNKDESNENDVLSDTIDILKDIIIEFKGHPYYVNSQLNIINDIDFESFTESFDEEVSGWSCEISLMTPVLNNFCGIPAEDITGFEFPGADCPDVNVLCPVMVEDVTGVSPIVVTTIGNTKQISLSGGVSSDTFVTGATYNNTTNKLEIERNDGVTIYADLSSFSTTDTFLSSGNYNSTSDELELTLSDNSTINIDLSSLNNTDTNDYLNGLDFNSNSDNKLTATLSDGNTIDVTIDNFDDLTVNGDVTATAFIGDGSQLTGLASGGDSIYTADGSLTGNRDIDSNGNTLLISNGSKSVGVDSWNVHTYWSLNNGSNAWTLLSANASGTFNQDEFGISFNGSSTVPFRIFGGDKIALGNVSKSNLDSSYSVNVKNGLIIQDGNFKHKSGVFTIETKANQEIRTFNNGYPSFYFDNNTTTYQLGNADASSGTFDEGDFFIYNNSTSKTNLLITKTGETIISNGSTAIVGTEKISLQDDTLVKGSDTSVVTSGFKVTDVNDDTILDIKNNKLVALNNNAPFKIYTGSGQTQSDEALSIASFSNGCYLDFNTGRTAIRTINDVITLSGQFKTSNKTNIILGADIIIQSKDTRSVQLKANHLFFMNNAGTTKGRINGNAFIWGSNTAIGNEDVSLQGDTLLNANVNTPNLPVFSNESDATTGGLSSGDWYRTVTGELRIKL